MKSLTDLDQESIAKEVTERFRGLIATLNEKDAETWATYQSENGFASAVAGGDFFATRDDWVQSITSLFSMRDHQQVDVRDVQVLPLAPDMALLTSQDTINMRLKGGQSNTYRHVFTVIWKKEQEGWQILHSHESWVDETAQ